MNRYQEGDQVFEDAPVTREPENLVCRHCHCEVIHDGYNGLVHADDYKYACQPGNANSKFAAVRHERH